MWGRNIQTETLQKQKRNEQAARITLSRFAGLEPGAPVREANRLAMHRSIGIGDCQDGMIRGTLKAILLPKNTFPTESSPNPVLLIFF